MYKPVVLNLSLYSIKMNIREMLCGEPKLKSAGPTYSDFLPKLRQSPSRRSPWMKASKRYASYFVLFNTNSCATFPLLILFQHQREKRRKMR